MASEPPCEAINLTQITPETAFAIGELLARVWPKPGKDAAFRAQQLIDLGDGYDGPAEHAPRTFFIRGGEQVIAAATMEPREIRFGGDQGGSTPMLIFGLGKVGSEPERRGEGLGARVVREAFRMIDDGAAAYSLFQTSHKVRPFYERLGACLVDNQIINSLGDDPDANPFTDEIAMRYPATGDWPTGMIDLRGPAY